MIKLGPGVRVTHPEAQYQLYESPMERCFTASQRGSISFLAGCAKQQQSCTMEVMCTDLRSVKDSVALLRVKLTRASTFSAQLERIAW